MQRALHLWAHNRDSRRRVRFSQDNQICPIKSQSKLDWDDVSSGTITASQQRQESSPKNKYKEDTKSSKNTKWDRSYQRSEESLTYSDSFMTKVSQNSDGDGSTIKTFSSETLESQNDDEKKNYFKELLQYYREQVDLLVRHNHQLEIKVKQMQRERDLGMNEHLNAIQKITNERIRNESLESENRALKRRIHLLETQQPQRRQHKLKKTNEENFSEDRENTDAFYINIPENELKQAKSKKLRSADFTQVCHKMENNSCESKVGSDCRSFKNISSRNSDSAQNEAIGLEVIIERKRDKYGAASSTRYLKQKNVGYIRMLENLKSSNETLSKAKKSPLHFSQVRI